MITNAQFDLLLQLTDPEERSTQLAALDSGVLNLAVAENVLVFDYLQAAAFSKARPLVVADAKYTTFYGDAGLRQEVAGFLSTHLRAAIDPDHVFGVGGVSAALACLAHAVLKPGDTVLMPAPCWQGFAWCFEQRRGCKLVTFQTARPQLSLADVTRALAVHKDARALVLTNPHNPTGVNYDEHSLNQIYDFVLKNYPNVHIISDEIYGLSQTLDATPPFVSALALSTYRDAPRQHKDRVHMVWGVAKDFGLSGFKTGFIVSTSPVVSDALRGKAPVKDLAWFTPVDSLKHWMLKQMFQAHDGGKLVRDEAIARYRLDLTRARLQLASLLTRRKIPFLVEGKAAQFFWLDLSGWLNRVPPADARSLFPEVDAREGRLASYLLNNAQVSLLPGQTLRSPAPGFFRLCFTAAKLELVNAAILRIADALDALPADALPADAQPPIRPIAVPLGSVK